MLHKNNMFARNIKLWKGKEISQLAAEIMHNKRKLVTDTGTTSMQICWIYKMFY
jgi:hypothetical protein